MCGSRQELLLGCVRLIIILIIIITDILLFYEYSVVRTLPNSPTNPNPNPCLLKHTEPHLLSVRKSRRALLCISASCICVNHISNSPWLSSPVTMQARQPPPTPSIHP